MATRLNSFTKTGVALASAAAVVAATPVVTPSLSLPTLPTPPALSQAQYELSNFETFWAFLTDPTAIEYALFTGWGFTIGPINIDPEEPVSDILLPQCNYDCSINGPSGVAYMLLDALFNGDSPDATTWSPSAINYVFEGGWPIGVQYVIQQPFQPGVLNPAYDPDLPPGPDNPEYLIPPGPLANQAIYDAIALAFQGPTALSTILLQVVVPVAISVVGAVPVVGPWVAGGISAFAYGYANELTGITGPQGFSGLLAYVTDYITQAIVGLGDLLPGGAASTPATTLAAAASVPSLRSAVAVAEPDVATVSAPADVESVATEDSASEVEESADDVAVTPVDEAAPAEEPAAVDEAPAAVEEVTEVDETEPVTPVEVPADVADEVTESAPADAEPAPVKAPKRPVRSAVERVTKSVQSALGGAAKADASDAGSASADAGSASADSGTADSE